MKVSICIPVFNGEKFIKKTIESVLNQTYRDFELIVIDNQSTDNTVKLVKSISDNRIKLYINETNLGMFGNWNACLKKASGEYIHILCADDCLRPTCIEKQVQVLDDNDDVVMVFNASNVVNDNDKKLMSRRPFKKNKIFDGKWIAVKSFRSRNIFGEPSNVLFRKKIANEVGYFCPEVCYSADWDYWLRIATYGRVGYISECLTDFRVSSSTGTSQLMKQFDMLVQDDRNLITRVKNNKKLSVTKYDILVHSIAIKARLVAKILFSMFVK